MTFKDHGYYGYAYIGARIAQGIALVPIIGLVGNFLSLIAKSKHSPPTELVATIIFTALSMLWILLSMTAYDDTHIPYLATFAVDLLFMIPFIVFAVILGQPLSVTTCSDLPKEASSVALPISSLAGQPVSYVVFSGSGQTVCYELMAAWGLIIALCVLFAISCIAAGFLFLGKRRSSAGEGSVMGGDGYPGMATFPGGGGYPMNESQIEMGPPKGSAFSSRSPSIGPNYSMPATPMPPHGMSPRGSFDAPLPPASPGLTDNGRPQPGHPLSPPPPPRF